MKYLSLVVIAVVLIFISSDLNMDYENCMEATKLDYISKEGADHISAQCNAFIKQKIMVK
jgi:hypothetical protein|tara:strand:+ start:609 stop:788 length:180 start_codon:yes stop_codon:yes gene_type:complete